VKDVPRDQDPKQKKNSSTKSKPNAPIKKAASKPTSKKDSQSKPDSEIRSPSRTKGELTNLKQNFKTPGLKDSDYKLPLILEQDSKSVSSRIDTPESNKKLSPGDPQKKLEKKPTGKARKSDVSASDKSHLSKAFGSFTDSDSENDKNSLPSIKQTPIP